MEVNKVYLGDCLELIKDIPDKSVDLLLTDPPYRIYCDGGGMMSRRGLLDKIQEEKLNEFNPIEFLEIVKPKMKLFHAYIFCSKDLLYDYIGWINKNDYNWDLLIMAKYNPIPTHNNKYLSDKEYVLFIREKGGCYFNNDLNHNYYYSVKNINVISSKYKHPTEKQVNYITDMIRISTKQNDLILDPFAGTGTTGLACIKENRNYILIEKEKKYYKIINSRIEQELDKIKIIF